MEKSYRLLSWLTTGEATHFLFQLTGTQVTADHLGKFCEGGHCNAYIACGSVKGEQYETTLSVCAGDVQKLLRPEQMTQELMGERDGRPEELLFAHRPLVAGAGWLYPKDHSEPKYEEYLEWHITTGPKIYEVIFKSAEIQALAAKMNGVDEQPDAAELKNLRRQLEQERAAREAAEVEAEELREEAEAEDNQWWKLCERERECRERTQAEVIVLEARIAKLETEAKPSHLLAIAGLLELLLDNNRPRYLQGRAANAVEALHPDWLGASASTLTKLFADAKTAAKDANLEAQAKAEAREAATAKAESRKKAKI